MTTSDTDPQKIPKFPIALGHFACYMCDHYGEACISTGTVDSYELSLRREASTGVLSYVEGASDVRVKAVTSLLDSSRQAA